MSKDLPLTITNLFGINRHDNTLRAKTIRRLTYKFRIIDRGGIDADLIRPGVEHATNIAQLADTATHRQRNKDLTRDCFDHMYHGLAFIRTGGNIEKNQLIGTLLVITTRDFNGVTSIKDIDKLHPFNHAAVIDIETGDNAFSETHTRSERQLNSDLFGKGVCQFLAFGKIKRIFVQCATNDGPHDPFFRDRAQCANIIHRTHPAGCNDRDCNRLCQRHC